MIIHIVGTRPNFMKLAPVWHAIAELGLEQCVIHTGQHYDANMSDVFFEQLKVPKPQYNLEIGSMSHAAQTAAILTAIEPLFVKIQPRWVVVYGDVNSTMAATLTAAKLGLRVAHVEAGLRSFDRTMPEELNRLVTDQLADLLLTPSVDADRNLAREGVSLDRIRFVGNVMIDTLIKALPNATLPPGIPSRFVLATLHRPSNVDEPKQLRRIMTALQQLAGDIPVVMPIHPRTTARLKALDIDVEKINGLLPLPPQGYLQFLALQRDAAVVITDSGGIQEETTYLQTPCLTLRHNTERPITIEMGTNQLLGQDCDLMLRQARAILASPQVKGSIPPLWDGKAGHRIAKILAASL